MVSSFVVALGFFIARKSGVDVPAHVSLLVTVAVDDGGVGRDHAVAPPADRATLDQVLRARRARRARMVGHSDAAGLAPSPDSLPQALLGWMFGCAFVYAALFGTGSLLYGRMPAVRSLGGRARRERRAGRARVTGVLEQEGS